MARQLYLFDVYTYSPLDSVVSIYQEKLRCGVLLI